MMKTKMLLILLAIVFVLSEAFITNGNRLLVNKWGLHPTYGCLQGVLLDDSNCGTSPANNGRCIVEFADEITANAFNNSDCVSSPLYKQH